MTNLQAGILSASLIALVSAADARAADATRIAEVRLVGLRAERANTLLDELATRVGVPLDEDAVAADIKRLWRTGLFADVSVELRRGGRVVVFRTTSHPLADVLVVAEEQGTLIEAIEIRGNGKTRDNVIRRELAIAPGDPLTREAVAKSAKKIRRLGFFKVVEVTVKPGSTPRLAVVTYRVTERPTGSFEVGASYGEISGVGFTASIDQANLFGTAHRLSLAARLAQSQQTFALTYSNPRILDSLWRGSASAYNSRRDFAGIRRGAVGGTATLGRPVSENTRIELGYRLENVWSEPIEEQILIKRTPGFADDLFGSGLTSSVRADLIHDSRHDKGLAAGVYGEIASEYLGSDNRFRRYGAWAHLPVDLGSGFELGFRARADWIGSGDPNGVPFAERLRVGYVRGYAPDDFGTRVSIGGSPVSIGGNLRLLASAELEFPLITAIGITGVAFAEVGNVFNTERRYCRDTVRGCPSALALLTGLRASVGAGFRWRSPIGKLRFEWGVPLVRRPGQPKVRFHLGVGQMML